MMVVWWLQPILSSRNLITKADEYGYLRPWLGDCLFLSTGQRWKERRRLLTPAFHFQMLATFLDVFDEQSRTLAERLEEARAAATDGVVDVFPLLTEATLNVICETSMGGRVRRLDQLRAYYHSVHRIGQITMERGLRPWLASDWLFPWTPLGRENRRCVDTLHRFTDAVIRDRRRTLVAEQAATAMSDDDPSTSKTSSRADQTEEPELMDGINNGSLI